MSASSTRFHLAQLNIAEPLAPVDSPPLAEFKAQLDPINAVADSSPGFIWRLQDEDGDATSFRAFDSETMLVNMSVWESVEALRAFVYGMASEHKSVMARRRMWFNDASEPFLVLWWIPAGHLPTQAEAEERLLRLRAEGPTAEAFDFRNPHLPPGAAGAGELGAAVPERRG